MLATSASKTSTSSTLDQWRILAASLEFAFGGYRKTEYFVSSYSWIYRIYSASYPSTSSTDIITTTSFYIYEAGLVGDIPPRVGRRHPVAPAMGSELGRGTGSTQSTMTSGGGGGSLVGGRGTDRDSVEAVAPVME